MSDSRAIFRDTLARIRPFIKPYLESRGVVPGRNGKYKCINPNHDDKTPSANLVPPDETVLYCFGCSQSLDVFRCASILEGRPSDGHEFVTDNVHYLADLFSIPYEPVDLTEEDLHRLKVRRLYSQAKDLLCSYKNADLVSSLYGWALDDVSKWGIGTVDTWKDFVDRLSLAADCSRAFIERVGITKQLFNEFCVTFTIHDAKGIVVGFGARDSRWTEGKDRHSKWINSPGSTLYNKSSLLYGLDSARHYNQIYIFEGYADVIEARLGGMLNCAALCGTAFTQGQVGLLTKLGKKEVILCLDTDENQQGQQAVERIVDTHFSGQEAIKVGIVELPTKKGASTDPRDYIRSEGIIAFKDVLVKDVYQWRLGLFAETAQPDEICEVMLPLILNEPRCYRRERHLRDLATHTGVRLKALQKDYDSLVIEVDQKRQARLVYEADTLRDMLRVSNGKDTKALVQRSFKKMIDIEGEASSISTFSATETADFIDQMQKEFNEKPEGLLGLYTGFDFWDNLIEGMPKKECIVSIGGVANVGKSAICSQLVWNMANHPENKDLIVLVMTIDDSRTQFIPRFVSLDTELPLNTVMHPKRYKLTADERKSMKATWKKLGRLVRSGRLNIKDTTHGATIGDADKWIRATRDENPDATIVFCLDNFHKLVNKHGLTDKAKVDYHSEEMDRITKSYQVTLLCTQELRKHERGKSSMEDLLGSAQMSYDNNLIFIMEQDLHHNRNSGLVWSREGEEGLLPINTFRVDKNKFSSWKGTQYLKFWPDRSKFYETVAPAEVSDDPTALPF